MKSNKILGVIPARFGSTRFPGKPLVNIWGKSMIRRVYEQCLHSNLFDHVIVATDDDRILKEVQGFGGEAMLTQLSHESGTDRCAEVINKLDKPYDVVVNIQGDEPFVHAEDLKLLIEAFTDGHVDIATLTTKIVDSNELFDPNKVKVVMNAKKEALYFSRSTIPFLRGIEKNEWIHHHTFYKHVGVYAYRSDVLKKITSLHMGDLEAKENLEQLRWLQAGYVIKLQYTDNEVIAVDTPEDLQKILENDALRTLKD